MNHSCFDCLFWQHHYCHLYDERVLLQDVNSQPVCWGWSARATCLDQQPPAPPVTAGGTQPPVTEWHKGSEKPEREQPVLGLWEVYVDNPAHDWVASKVVYWSGECWRQLLTDEAIRCPDYWARIDWEGRHKA